MKRHTREANRIESRDSRERERDDRDAEREREADRDAERERESRIKTLRGERTESRRESTSSRENGKR